MNPVRVLLVCAFPACRASLLPTFLEYGPLRVSVKRLAQRPLAHMGPRRQRAYLNA
jgi:hypothetical protein